MNRSILTGTILALCLLSSTNAIAEAAPKYDITFETAATGLVSVFCKPDGGGDSFLEAHDSDGTEVDATVILTFRDSGMIVQPYQVESLSLVTDNGGVVPCTIGTVPEFDLSVGYVWQTPIQVGGYSNYVSDEDFEQLCFAINDEMQEGYALDILFNSGDLHTDTGIGVQDVVIFKVKYTDLEYHYEIDYHFDKRIDLADLVLFAASLNTVCP